MKDWYSAQDLAGLPGMPAKKRFVRRKAAREGWSYREVKGGRGDPRREYPLTDLPAETQAHLRGQTTALAPAIAAECRPVNPPQNLQNLLNAEDIAGTLERAANFQRKEQSLIQYQSLPIERKNRADVKLDILCAITEIAREIGYGKAVTQLLHRYSDCPEWTAVIPHLSQATIYRWKKFFRDNGIAALSGRYPTRKPTLKELETDIHNIFMSVLHHHPTASAVHIQDLLLAAIDPATPKPSLRTTQRWLADWRRQNPGINAFLVNPDQARGRLRPAQGDASEDVTRLLQRWELDSTPSDVMLNGQRHVVIGCIDVWSRRAKLLVAKTSKATAIALLIRRCILDWGVPEECKTDNGQDYISRYLARVLSALEIEHTRCPPFSPWIKPHIERFFRTFSHGIAELLPGYIGHNIQDQQARRSRSFTARFMSRGETVELTLDPEQFQQFCDTWADGIYAQQPHSKLGCSPSQRWMSYNGEIKRVSTERALDLLLAEGPGGEFRTIQKKGIQIDTHYYIAPEFGDPNLVGQRVRVLLDPLDLGKVVVLDGNFRFLCLATCPALAGTDRRQIALAAQNLQKERLQAARQSMRDAAKKVKLVDALDSHLRIAADKAKVIPLPTATAAIEHQTPALAAAAAAIQASEPRPSTPESAEERARADAIIDAWEAQAADTEEPGDRYYRLWKRQQAGLSVTAEETAWMEHFATTPEGRGLLRFLEADEVDIRTVLKRGR